MKNHGIFANWLRRRVQRIVRGAVNKRVGTFVSSFPKGRVSFRKFFQKRQEMNFYDTKRTGVW